MMSALCFRVMLWNGPYYNILPDMVPFPGRKWFQLFFFFFFIKAVEKSKCDIFIQSVIKILFLIKWVIFEQPSLCSLILWCTCSALFETRVLCLRSNYSCLWIFYKFMSWRVLPSNWIMSLKSLGYDRVKGQTNGQNENNRWSSCITVLLGGFRERCIEDASPSLFRDGVKYSW